MAGFGEWGNGTVIFFLGGPLNILEVCDRKKAVLLEEAWALKRLKNIIVNYLSACRASR